jgi:hypothetical protein
MWPKNEGMVMELMARKADIAEALSTFSCTLSHFFHCCVYPYLMFWLLMQTLNEHFCYQDFSTQKFMSTLPFCINLNAALAA